MGSSWRQGWHQVAQKRITTGRRWRWSARRKRPRKVCPGAAGSENSAAAVPGVAKDGAASEVTRAAAASAAGRARCIMAADT